MRAKPVRRIESRASASSLRHRSDAWSFALLLHPLAMVHPHSIALRGALRTLRARPTLPQQRFFGVSARYQAEKPQQASFKSQLYESTQARLKRERAEQERFAQYQTQSPGGRYAALLFGTSLRPSRTGRR